MKWKYVASQECLNHDLLDERTYFMLKQHFIFAVVVTLTTCSCWSKSCPRSRREGMWGKGCIASFILDGVCDEQWQGSIWLLLEIESWFRSFQPRNSVALPTTLHLLMPGLVAEITSVRNVVFFFFCDVRPCSGVVTNQCFRSNILLVFSGNSNAFYLEK
jgi:hypothetical protein